MGNSSARCLERPIRSAVLGVPCSKSHYPKCLYLKALGALGALLSHRSTFETEITILDGFIELYSTKTLVDSSKAWNYRLCRNRYKYSHKGVVGGTEIQEELHQTSQMEGYSISSRGNWEYATSNTATYSRRIGTSQWTLVSQLPAEPALGLMLVRKYQATGEPSHWSLFVAREGESGTVYQVLGDATDMHHSVTTDVNLLSSQSIRDVYQLATITPDQAARVGYCAAEESPPSAINRAHVTENCQGWTVRVLAGLIRDGIVGGNWYETVRGMMEPV